MYEQSYIINKEEIIARNNIKKKKIKERILSAAKIFDDKYDMVLIYMRTCLFSIQFMLYANEWIDVSLDTKIAKCQKKQPKFGYDRQFKVDFKYPMFMGDLLMVKTRYWNASEHTKYLRRNFANVAD